MITSAQNCKPFLPIFKSLRVYINDYLTEEIKAESLTRNLVAFAEFLRVAAQSNAEMLNYSNIARECGVDSKTIKEYYQILVDTLLGYYLPPYKNKKCRQDLVATPKFYFFDVGVVNALAKHKIVDLTGPLAGKAFEHYLLMEIMAYRGIHDLDFDIQYWRTKAGTEVDFILGNAEVAIEVKITDTLKSNHLKGLQSFQTEYKPKRTLLINTAARKRKISTDNGDIEILPWQTFLNMLWAGNIIND